MGARENGLRDRGWNDLGGGWWSHNLVENGQARFGLEEAIAREQQRTDNRIEALTIVLDQVREKLGLTCSYSEMPAAIEALLRTEISAHALAGRTIKEYLGRKRYGPVKSDVDVKVDSEQKEADGKTDGKPICPNCQAPMTLLPRLAGQSNQRLMCESCGHTISEPLKLSDAEIVAKADTALDEMDKRDRTVPRQLTPAERLEELETDYAEHEQAIDILANWLLRRIEMPATARPTIEIEEAKMLEKWRK